MHAFAQANRSTFHSRTKIPNSKVAVITTSKTIEVHEAIRSFDYGSAAGLDGVLPEILRKAGSTAETALVVLFNATWRSLAP